jgi:hypothetical protein
MNNLILRVKSTNGQTKKKKNVKVPRKYKEISIYLTTNCIYYFDTFY